MGMSDVIDDQTRQQCDAGCYRELMKRWRGSCVIMGIEWSEDWSLTLQRMVQRVNANDHLGKLASERYDRILELERQIADGNRVLLDDTLAKEEQG